MAAVNCMFRGEVRGYICLWQMSRSPDRPECASRGADGNTQTAGPDVRGVPSTGAAETHCGNPGDPGTFIVVG